LSKNAVAGGLPFYCWSATAFLLKMHTHCQNCYKLHDGLHMLGRGMAW